MKLVSVVIPMYNAEKTISQCLNSLIRQTYPRMEIIVIDDGSTDRSLELCEKYAQRDSRIVVIHQENQGSVEARRQGILRSSGEFITFLDSDDTLPKHSIARLEENMGDADLCIGAACRMVNRLKLKAKNPSPCFCIAAPKHYTWEKFRQELYCSWFGITNVPVWLCGKMFRACLLKKIYMETPKVVSFYGDDLIVTLRYLPVCHEIVIIPDIIYNYRIGGGSSKYNPAMMEDWLALYRYKKPFAEKYPMPQDIEKLMDIELCNMVYSYLTMLGRSGKFTEQEILRKTHEVTSIDEVNAAIRNPKTTTTKFPAIQKMKEQDWNGLVAMVMSDVARYKKTDWIRKLITYFA